MEPFRFKHFTVAQDRCAMKIGTDSVLLGAWTPITSHPETILDIGAGTGILALQMAQRTDAFSIDAIEIDDEAYEQCVENFENSDWGDRLFCYHAALDEFVEEIDDKYDLIISNPPFYTEAHKTQDASRDMARFADALPFENLISGVATLLSKDGIFSVIIPKKEEARFTAIAETHDLYPFKICHVHGHAHAEPKRSLMAFSFSEIKCHTETLTIEVSRHVYTQEYIDLVGDFYLKM